MAQRWLGSEGRRTPPPHMGEVEGGEPEGGEGKAESSSYESLSSYTDYTIEAEAE